MDNKYNEYFYSYDEIKEKFPFKLPFLDECLICKSKELFNTYLNYNDNNKVAIDSSGKSFVNKKLIFDLLTNEELYKYYYLLRGTDNNIACDIVYIENNHEEHIILTKKQFAYAFNILHDELFNYKDGLYLSRLIDDIYMLSVNYCYDFYKKTMPIYNCYIDKKNKMIPTNRLIDILNFSDEEFSNFLYRNKYYNLTIEETLYMLVDFVEKNNILTKFDFSDDKIERYNRIKNYEYVDFESINMFNPTVNNKKPRLIRGRINNIKGKYIDGDLITGKYTIDKYLKDEVYKGMNPEYDQLEKAIYIYIKLCDLLSFKETEAFSFNNYIKEDLDYDRFNYINSVNNNVVSSEFILIYAKLLKEIGIKFKPFIDCTIGYENKYAYLSFKTSEYIIKVDLFNKSIIQNDLSKVKTGLPIDGIRCLNTNKVTRNKFKEKKRTIYSLYKKETNKDKYITTMDNTKDKIDNTKNIDLIVSFNKALRELVKNDLSNIYYKLYVINNNLTLDMKIIIALNCIKNVDINGIVYINYVQTILKSILSEDEHIDYKLYKYNNPDDNHEYHGVIISSGNYNYLITTEDKEVYLLSNSDLNKLNNHKDVSIIDYTMPNRKR